MRKRISPAIMERAVEAVPVFKDVLEEQVTLRGQSQSTLDNYSWHIALFVLHFNALPEHVDEDQINEYLATLARDHKAPSRSSFKYMPACRKILPQPKMEAHWQGKCLYLEKKIFSS